MSLRLFPRRNHALVLSCVSSLASNQRGQRWALSSSPRKPGDSDEQDENENDDEGLSRGAGQSINVLGTHLQPCCTNVGGSGIGTGFYRNGYCSTGPDDLGRHTVCVKVTEDFLQFSQSVGNDLSTPAPQWSFPGLKEGDIWCLCAQRWVQAYQAKKAPRLFLQGTHEKTLNYISLEQLLPYALDQDEAQEVLQKLNQQRAKLEKLL
ncbi:hypothetical protein ACA910_001917 [Epithemia clementina (nom. ined.)]